MTLSELIEELKQYSQSHGEDEVFVEDGEAGARSIYGLSYSGLAGGVVIW